MKILIPNIDIGNSKNSLRNVYREFETKWKKYGRKFDILESRESFWLHKIISFNTNGQTCSDNSDVNVTNEHRGRPIKVFSNLAKKTKLKRAKDLRENYTQDELLNALFQSTLKRHGYVKKKVRNVKSEEEMEDEALSLFVDCRLTKRQYQMLRSYNTRNGIANDHYPSYMRIFRAKKRCHPPFTVEESGCSVNLKDMLIHTTERLMKATHLEGQKNLKIVCKWGIDSTQLKNFHQRTEDSLLLSENSSLVSIGFVPLKLINKENDEPLWTNPKPCCSRYCRPIEICFQKETKQYVKERYNYYQNNIDSLGQILFRDICLELEMHCTMLDGKSVNAITDTISTSSCSVCHSGPSTSMDPQWVDYCDNDDLKFSLPVLHSRINIMTFVLNQTYRKDIKDLSPFEKKSIIDQRKNLIKLKFAEQLNLYIDRVEHGKGNSNTGNISRRFFKSYDITASILGLEPSLIKNLYMALEVINCKYTVNTAEFKTLTSNILQQLKSEFNITRIPPTLHKVLFHTCALSNHFELPLVYFSEEALEASHQLIKRARSGHSRRTSISNNNQDIFRYLMVLSDPSITVLSTSKMGPTAEHNIPSEALKFLNCKFWEFHLLLH